MNHPSRQSGSAFFLILFAIAAFGALSYIVFKDSRGSEGALGSEKAKLAAEEIIAYGETLAMAVQKLRLAGCEDTQLDFENAAWLHLGVGAPVHGPGHNPNAPSTGCSVFSAADGKVKAVVFPQSYFKTGSPHARIRRHSFLGVGVENNQDLAFWLTDLRYDVCMKINDLLGIENPGGNPPAYDPGTIPDYNGVYGTGGAYTDVSGVLAGKTAFCAEKTGNAGNRYMKILIAR